ncbi:MAG TPA: ABC transporter ATP-binding protein [Syntrophorhabdaceae bacterium]|nr:ABC transporter ATP-binding protein [Syntrophorhabdaceae bacterium]
MDDVLNIDNLHTYFFTDEGIARAVDGVSLSIGRNRTLGLVGESGCGKSVTALSVLRLVPSPPGRIVEGNITLAGRQIASLSEIEMRDIRGRLASMIFQEPMTSLNAVFTVGTQIMEAVEIHTRIGRNDAREVAMEYLTKVGIPGARGVMSSYPHQLSGGMKQRVMIAMALCLKPALLIADEPTTALDVTIQAGILRLMKDLQQDNGCAVLLITHDLGVVAEMADEVAVMYAGKIVESGPCEAIFASFLHPYTEGLFKSLPGRTERGAKLYTITGTVPSALKFPEACRFHTRCPLAIERCRLEEPPLVEVAVGHRCACWVRAGEVDRNHA